MVASLSMLGMAGCGHEDFSTARIESTDSSDSSPSSTPTTYEASPSPVESGMTDDGANPEDALAWGAIRGEAHLAVKDEDGRTAQVNLRWYKPEVLDLSNNSDSGCEWSGTIEPTWDENKAWMRMHLEADFTNTTQGFEWPDGYGGVLTNRGMPDTLSYCKYGDVTDQGSYGRNGAWIGSLDMDGDTSGITWIAESQKTPNQPHGNFAGVTSEWDSFHWWFPDVVKCEVTGALQGVLHDDGACEIGPA